MALEEPFSKRNRLGGTKEITNASLDEYEKVGI